MDTVHRRERKGIAGGENRLYEGTERGKKMACWDELPDAGGAEADTSQGTSLT
ncbi:hypothetical protein H8959_002507 [Pygathrix nigripes]